MTMATPVQQIPVVFCPTYGNSLDSRQELDYLTSLATKIPKAIRYPGLEVWVADQEKWYFFDGGVEDSDFVPSENRLIICQNKNEYAKVYSLAKAKRDGQIVYLENPGAYYKQEGGQLVPVFANGILNISAYSQIALNNEYYNNNKIVGKPIGQVLYFLDQKAFYFDPVGPTEDHPQVPLEDLIPMGTIEVANLTIPQSYGRPGTIYTVGADKEPYIIAITNKPVRAFRKRVKVNISLVPGNNVITHNLNTKHINVDAMTNSGTRTKVGWDYIDANSICVYMPASIAEPIECYVTDNPALEP